MNEKLKSALIGGVIVGIASGLPYIGAVNTACCALYIGGGVLALYLFMKDLPPAEKAPYGDGAVVGLLVGLIGGVVATLTLLVTGGITDQADQVIESLRMAGGQGVDIPQGILELFDTSGGASGGLILLNLVLSVVTGAIAACIGGLVGAAIFHKKQATGDA
ncbi:MAG: hypothetical protein J4F38_09185 [Pseudomonadales bacterium]|nr:hypothetical protein [Pseudomonadales bacterium]